MALDIPFPAHDASLVPVPRQPGLAHVRLSEFLDLTPPLSFADVPPTLPPPLALKPSSHSAVVVKKRRATAPEEPRQKNSAKAKKVQRDEIDDIFS